MTKIAFLGLGAMGSRMARRLLDAGHELTIWNRTAPDAIDWAGAKIAASPRDAASGADMVFAMVRDDAAAADVWLHSESGALAGMHAGALAVDCSTVSTDWARTLHAACAESNVDCLDAPVVGSRPQAEAGALIFLVGGAEATVGRAAPALSAMGSAIHHSGDAGSGAATKLLINALFGIQVTAIAELLGLASAQGLDLARIAAIIGETPVASPALKGAMGGMLAGAFAPMFPIDLVAKDFALAHNVSQQHCARTPMTDTAATVFNAALAAGLGTENLTAAAKLYR
ncbi:MAG: NAD(P)-dependent oxidoreductase [Sphingomonas sp.]|nr:NAD(P)-dependent oxidoreductase [Sphingomonas sp.]